MRCALYIPDGAGSTPKSSAEAFSALRVSWFFQKRSSEAMLRGSKNDHVTFTKLATYNWIDGLYHYGIPSVTAEPWFVCSHDGILTLRYNLSADLDDGSEDECGPHASVCIGGVNWPLAVVEVKTAPYRRTLDPLLP